MKGEVECYIQFVDDNIGPLAGGGVYVYWCIVLAGWIQLTLREEPVLVIEIKRREKESL